jgi:hypothetical protein
MRAKEGENEFSFNDLLHTFGNALSAMLFKHVRVHAGFGLNKQTIKGNSYAKRFPYSTYPKGDINT